MEQPTNVEHIWADPQKLPMTILHLFPLGAATVWIDEQFTAAMPASDEQFSRLADLFEEANRTGDLTEYFNYRDELCGEHPFTLYIDAFDRAMQRKWSQEEAMAVASRKYALTARLN